MKRHGETAHEGHAGVRADPNYKALRGGVMLVIVYAPPAPCLPLPVSRSLPVAPTRNTNALPRSLKASTSPCRSDTGVEPSSREWS